jgi:hypothetical protein
MRRGRLGSLIPRALCGGALRDYCGSLSRETRSGAGRRPRFLLPVDIPLQGGARRGRPEDHASARTGRLGRRDGRDALQGTICRSSLSFCLNRRARRNDGCAAGARCSPRGIVLSGARTFQVRALPASLPRNDHRTPATSDVPPIPPKEPQPPALPPASRAPGSAPRLAQLLRRPPSTRPETPTRRSTPRAARARSRAG